jgi:hypothetical protein
MSVVKSSNASSLASEFVTAREKYNGKLSSILQRASQRRGIISESIADLRAEDDSLAKVEAQVKDA